MRLSSLRKTVGSRQGRACHPFRGGRGVKHVRQTLLDVSAPIGNMERGFSAEVLPRDTGMRGMWESHQHHGAPDAPQRTRGTPALRSALFVLTMGDAAWHP